MPGIPKAGREEQGEGMKRREESWTGREAREGYRVGQSTWWEPGLKGEMRSPGGRRLGSIQLGR